MKQKQVRATKSKLSSTTSDNGQGTKGKPYDGRAYDYDADKAVIRTIVAYNLFLNLYSYKIRQIRNNPNTPEARIVAQILNSSNVSNAARDRAAIFWDEDTKANFSSLDYNFRYELYINWLNVLSDSQKIINLDCIPKANNWPTIILDDIIKTINSKNGQFKIDEKEKFDLWKGGKHPNFVHIEGEWLVIDIFKKNENLREVNQKNKDYEKLIKKREKLIKEGAIKLLTRLEQIRDPNVLSICEQGSKGKILPRPRSLFPKNSELFGEFDRSIIQAAFVVHNVEAEHEQKRRLEEAKLFVCQVEKQFQDDQDWVRLKDFQKNKYELYYSRGIKKFIENRAKLLNEEITFSDLEAHIEPSFFDLVNSNHAIWNTVHEIKVDNSAEEPFFKGSLLEIFLERNEFRTIIGKKFTYNDPFNHTLFPNFGLNNESAQFPCELKRGSTDRIGLSLIDCDGNSQEFEFLVGKNNRFSFKEKLFSLCGKDFDISKMSFRLEIRRSDRKKLFNSLSPELKKILSNQKLLFSKIDNNFIGFLNRITDEVFEALKKFRSSKNYMPFYLAIASSFDPAYIEDDIPKQFGVDRNIGDDDYWATTDESGNVIETGSLSVTEQYENNRFHSEKQRGRLEQELKDREIEINNIRNVLKLAKTAFDMSLTDDSDKLKKLKKYFSMVLEWVCSADTVLKIEKIGFNYPDLDGLACELYKKYTSTSQHLGLNKKVIHRYHGGLSFRAIRFYEKERDMISAFHKRRQPNGVQFKSIKNNNRYQRIIRKIQNLREALSQQKAALETKKVVELEANRVVQEDLKSLSPSIGRSAGSNKNITNWRKGNQAEQFKNNLDMFGIKHAECYAGETSSTSAQDGMPIVRVSEKDDGNFTLDDTGKVIFSINEGKLCNENAQTNAAINISRRYPKKNVLFRCKVQQIIDTDLFAVVSGNKELINKLFQRNTNSVRHTYKITRGELKTNQKLIGQQIVLYCPFDSGSEFKKSYWYALEREKRVSIWEVTEALTKEGKTLITKTKKP